MVANDFIAKVTEYFNRHNISYTAIEADGNLHIVVSFPEYKRRYSVTMLTDAILQNLHPMGIPSQIIE